MSEDRSTTLYRYFDVEGTLLYVGIAYDADQRKKGHSQSAAESWYPLIAERRIEVFDTRAEAEDAEVRAIRSEKPRFNRRHVAQRGPEVRADDLQREQRKWRVAAATQSTGTPQYFTIYRYLSEKIDSGWYAPGESLPTKTQLLKTFGTTGPTLSRAYQELENNGYIEKAGIKGYVVLPPEERRVAICVGRPEEAAAALRAAMTGEQLAALLVALQQAAEDAA